MGVCISEESDMFANQLDFYHPKVNKFTKNNPRSDGFRGKNTCDSISDNEVLG